MTCDGGQGRGLVEAPHLDRRGLVEPPSRSDREIPYIVSSILVFVLACRASNIPILIL